MDTAQKAGWRIPEWGTAAGLKKSTIYTLIAAGELKAVKVGRATIITTPPAEFLSRCTSKAAA